MRRSRTDAPTRPELVGGMFGMLWRCRLELALGAASFVGFLLLAGLVGDVAAAILVGGLIAALLAGPGLRGWLLHALRAARVRRAWWRRAWTDCELPRVRAGRVSAIPAGELVRVRASRGSSLEYVEQRAEQLAVCLRAREVRVTRDADDAATGTVTLVRRDPLAGLASVPWPHRDAEPLSLSLWEPIPVGLDELGATVSVSLPERNVLLSGEPGAGKSAALSILVATAALDPTAKMWLLDGKLVELAAWTPCAQRVAGPDVDEAIALLRELREEMESRYRELLARRKITREDGLSLHLVVCAELAFYLGSEDRKKQRGFAELLRDLVARGRAAGVIVCAATQKPASDVVPSALRDLFGFRLALRCNTPQASDAILGQGWATLGHNAASIAPGQRGVGLLLAEDGTPVRLRGFHLTDADVDALASRAAALRADDWIAGPEERAA